MQFMYRIWSVNDSDLQGYCQLDVARVKSRYGIGRIRSGYGSRTPVFERASTQQSVVLRTEMVTPEVEQILDDAVDRQKSLCLTY